MTMDSCICPSCNAILDVDIYGHDLECSECYCKINVFRDTDLLLETELGTVGISLPKEEMSWLKTLMRFVK